MIIAQRQLDELCLYKIIFNLDVPKRAVPRFLFRVYAKPYTNFRRQSNQILPLKMFLLFFQFLRSTNAIWKDLERALQLTVANMSMAKTEIKLRFLMAFSWNADSFVDQANEVTVALILL